MYFRAALVGMQVCFRLHTFYPSARVTLAAAANNFPWIFLFSSSFSKQTVVVLMYCSVVGMAQILPLAKPSVFSGGCRAHWHSWADTNPCAPRRHSTTLIISLRCSLKSFLFVRGGGAFQKIVTQGCDLRARLAACSEIRPFLNHAQAGWEIRVPHWTL